MDTSPTAPNPDPYPYSHIIPISDVWWRGGARVSARRTKEQGHGRGDSDDELKLLHRLSER